MRLSWTVGRTEDVVNDAEDGDVPTKRRRRRMKKAADRSGRKEEDGVAF